MATKRHQPPTRYRSIQALFEAPLIYQISEDLRSLNPKTRTHPIELHLAYGALARLLRSANRLDTELQNTFLWAQIVDLYNQNNPNQPNLTQQKVLTSDTYRHFRNWLTTDTVLAVFLDSFTKHSVATAQSIGLIHPNGSGSRTQPHPTRTIYGDGTIIKPLCSQPNTTRTDPDAKNHTRHDGAITGNGLVAISTRKPQTQQRVILSVGHIPKPGQEAEVAIKLIKHVHSYAKDGIQAVVYDGAFRGKHHQTIMNDLGLIVVNKVAPTNKNNTKNQYKQIMIGTKTHTTNNNVVCTHTLIAQAGAIHETNLNQNGETLISTPLERKQIRRRQNRDQTYRFALCVTIPCHQQPFTTWINPHPQQNDTTYQRPENIRLIHENDPYFQTLYGLRNDSESINAHYKASLPHKRAAAIGWQRQTIDLASWALLTNTLAWYTHHN